MILLIDNYDSFTYNLVQYLGELGATLEVHRNDEISVSEVMARRPAGIILSPGPGRPEGAGICLDLIRNHKSASPLLGVCLGHQAIGMAFGGDIVQAAQLMHGKTSHISHVEDALFAHVGTPFEATRYHSLVVDPRTLPQCLRVTAQTDDGTIMGLQHRTLPIHGVQFHPESILTPDGKTILANFLALCNEGDRT